MSPADRSPGWIRPDHSGLGDAGKRAALTAMQGGRCAVCQTGGPLQADHDHDTGLLRGMLCQSCNVREGRTGGDPAIDAYRASPPAAALGWMWKLPDWWTPADTREAAGLGLTAAEYAAPRGAARRHAAREGVFGMLPDIELPAVDDRPRRRRRRALPL